MGVVYLCNILPKHNNQYNINLQFMSVNMELLTFFLKYCPGALDTHYTISSRLYSLTFNSLKTLAKPDLHEISNVSYTILERPRMLTCKQTYMSLYSPWMITTRSFRLYFVETFCVFFLYWYNKQKIILFDYIVLFLVL